MWIINNFSKTKGLGPLFIKGTFIYLFIKTQLTFITFLIVDQMLFSILEQAGNSIQDSKGDLLAFLCLYPWLLFLLFLFSFEFPFHHFSISCPFPTNILPLIFILYYLYFPYQFVIVVSRLIIRKYIFGLCPLLAQSS